MNVRWTLEAQNQLQEIYEYVARDDPRNACTLVNKLIAQAETLNNPPFLGRVVPELGDPKIRELLERPYRIIYCVLAKQLLILTIWHYRRLLRAPDVAAPLLKLT
jgi:toxin ParE1/3/4